MPGLSEQTASTHFILETSLSSATFFPNDRFSEEGSIAKTKIILEAYTISFTFTFAIDLALALALALTN